MYFILFCLFICFIKKNLHLDDVDQYKHNDRQRQFFGNLKFDSEF